MVIRKHYYVDGRVQGEQALVDSDDTQFYID